MNLPQQERGQPLAGSAHGGVAGHRMYCSKCRAFRVQGIALETNGKKMLVMTCTECDEQQKFVHVVGGWMPENLLSMLDLFASARIAQAETDREMAEMLKLIKDSTPEPEPKKTRFHRKPKETVGSLNLGNPLHGDPGWQRVVVEKPEPKKSRFRREKKSKPVIKPAEDDDYDPEMPL
jgi:hypothetical protein